MMSLFDPYSDDMLAKIKEEHTKGKEGFSKEVLIEMKKANEERRKLNQKRKKMSREENHRKYWRWDDNKPKKNNVKSNENIPKKTDIEGNTKNDTNSNPSNTNRKLRDPFNKTSIIAEDHSNKSVFDEEGNPIDSVDYFSKATGKTYRNTMKYSFKK